MKKLKKTVCVLLAVLLLCGVSAMAVHAQEEQTPAMDALLKTFKAYLDENGVEYKDWEELVEVKYNMTSNGWTIFMGYPGFELPAFASERIGEYIFFSSNYFVPFKIGIYAEKNGTILTLKEAHQEKKIDLEQVVNSGKFTAYLIGDTNIDNVVNLTDVLILQKVIAKMIAEPVTEMDWKAERCDYNGDGEITIDDVLDMQKDIAKI